MSLSHEHCRCSSVVGNFADMHDAQNLSPGIINRKEKERKEGRKRERG
jgi:hypothetical protein